MHSKTLLWRTWRNRGIKFLINEVLLKKKIVIFNIKIKENSYLKILHKWVLLYWKVSQALKSHKPLQVLTSLLQAFDKPTESCFLKANFRLYWIQENTVFIFKNYLCFIDFFLFLTQIIYAVYLAILYTFHFY